MEHTFFGDKLALLRQRQGISRKDFADLMQMPVNTIAGYENLGREAKYSTLIKFADYFNVSIDELLREKEKISSIDEKISTDFNIGEHKVKIQMLSSGIDKFKLFDASKDFAMKAESKLDASDLPVNISVEIT